MRRYAASKVGKDIRRNAKKQNELQNHIYGNRNAAHGGGFGSECAGQTNSRFAREQRDYYKRGGGFRFEEIGCGRAEGKDHKVD